MTIPNQSDYEKHDVNETQSHIFELIRKIAAPVNGQALVDLLVKKRMLWFAVYPIVLSNAIAPMEVSHDSFYADGLCIYTDVQACGELVSVFENVKGVSNVSFVNLSRCNSVEDDEPVAYPKESTVFVNVSWDIPKELEERFVESVI